MKNRLHFVTKLLTIIFLYATNVVCTKGHRRQLTANRTIVPTRRSSSSSLSTHSPTISSSNRRGSTEPHVSTLPTSSQFPVLTSSSPTTNVSLSTKSPTIHPTRITTQKTSRYPTMKPTTKEVPTPHHHESWLIFFLKFIGWIIFLALSMVLFGMCMSYRYHLYYFLLQSWYILRRSWICIKLQHFFFFWRWRSSRDDIVSDQGDLLEGLLLQQRDS